MLKHAKRVGISIDMTPMVDVAFLLLIFFMTTTQFKPPERDKIDLPESSSPVKAPEADVITINVTHDNRITMEYRKRGDLQRPDIADPEQLRAGLQDARMAAPGARILVKVDKKANYGTMQDIMQVLQEENATRFNIVTELKMANR